MAVLWEGEGQSGQCPQNESVPPIAPTKLKNALPLVSDFARDKCLHDFFEENFVAPTILLSPASPIIIPRTAIAHKLTCFVRFCGLGILY